MIQEKYREYGSLLFEVVDAIEPLDGQAVAAARERLDRLTKPLGSLGRLEDLVAQLAGITRSPIPDMTRKAIVIMCADNGVVTERVAQVGSEITASVTRNFTKGLTAVNVFSKLVNAELAIVNIGVQEEIDCASVLNRRVRNGTSNITKGPAMSEHEVLQCIETGIEVVSSLKKNGIQVLGTGEMGIGNTTTSSAIIAVLLRESVNKVVGRGAGLSDDGLKRKCDAIERAITVNCPDRDDPIDVLRKLGGFDIAGLVGCYLGAAAHRIPILIDGFISATAALIADRITCQSKQYMIPSHFSSEPGTAKVFEALALSPYLRLDMRVGEGTGSALGFFVVDAAIAAYTGMGTFDDANIEQYQKQN